MGNIEPGVIISLILVCLFLSDFVFRKKDGPYEVYYRSGQLKEKGAYKNSELDGLFEEYYRNGQLSEKGTFKDGEPHGPFEGYHESGELAWKGTYHMGEECGEWMEESETITYDPCPDCDDE